MTTYVLVGGAWIGSWAWQAVAEQLRTRGHRVYPITLTGLGERAHLARPEIDLETHIEDVVKVIEYEDLGDVVLAGHSYAGCVVPGVADRIGDRLSHLVYVDSAPLENGQRFADLFGPDGEAQLRQAADAAGDGWRWPFPGVEALATDASLRGVGERELAWMTEKCVDHPLGTLTQPLRLTGDGPGAYERVVIACDDFHQMLQYGIPSIMAMAEAPWRRYDLDTGHWPMLSMPEELAAVLHEIGSVQA